MWRNRRSEKGEEVDNNCSDIKEQKIIGVEQIASIIIKLIDATNIQTYQIRSDQTKLNRHISNKLESNQHKSEEVVECIKTE